MTTRQQRCNKSIHVNVRQEFEIPAVYLKGGLEEIEEALSIGATIQSSIKTMRSNDDIRRITEEKDSEIQRIQTTYQERMTKLSDELQSMGTEKARLLAEVGDRIRAAQKGERDVCTKESEESIRLLRKEHDLLGTEKARLLAEVGDRIRAAQKGERDICTKESEESIRLLRKEHDLLVARYDSAEARKRLLEENRAKDIQDAVTRTEQLMGKIVSSKEDQLTKMEATFHRLQDSIVKQSEEISKLSSNMGKRAANVKTKGNDYEEQFGAILRRQYGMCGGFGLRSTGLGAGHEMDFAMDLEGNVVMWELKNYTSLVPKAEVDKFLRDLKENPQAKIGVMISRTTDIHGKNAVGSLSTEFDGDKMMIYINRFEEFCGEDEGKVFGMLLSLFRIWWQYHKEENQGFDRVEIIREVEKAVEEIAKRRTEWRRHKAHLDEMSRWAMDLLDESEGRLDRILKKVRNVADVVHESEVPEGVFRETGEEKERLWTQSIMRCCVAGGDIEIRLLVDLLRVHHKLSADTIRSNIMAVLKDSAVVKKGIVKYVRGISQFVPPCQIKM